MQKSHRQINASAWTARFLVLAILIIPVTIPGNLFSASLRETPVVKAVRRVGPAVVNISSEYEVRTRISPFGRMTGNPYYDSFFKDFFDPRWQQREKRANLGSGVIIDGRRGYILTNAHVIEKASTILVTLKDQREFTATIIGADPESDLAVLQIRSGNGLPSVEMGASDDIMIGETVIAIGNPFGFSHTVTTGVVSAVNRSIKTDEREYHDFIQTDASINPGNSGGPLLNIEGDLIGINTAVYSSGQGIGFAIPIDKARRIISDLIRYGSVILPWTGMDVQNLTPHVADYLNIDPAGGVIIDTMASDGPAVQAGLQEGDVITAIGRLSIRSRSDFRTAVKGYAANDTIPVTVWREGASRQVNIETRPFPKNQSAELTLKLLDIKIRKTRHYNGVEIWEMHRRSYLYRIGVRPGDGILQINDTAIQDEADFYNAIRKNRLNDSMVLLIHRSGQGYYITVAL
ncbi:MAG: serine protease Do [Deltaproteobacteria bacterium]|nr:MAG: serine protease Do [Deltaproteobacteria bacterium]